jgi:predicted permease
MIEMLAVTLIPIFFGLTLGYLAGIFKTVDNLNVRTLVSFVMNFALPCSLFLVILKAPRNLLMTQGALVGQLVVVYLVLYAATYFFSRRLLRGNAQDSSVLALTLGFPNVTAVGIPLLDAMYGSRTAVPVAIGIAAGAMTISPLTLAILENNTPSVHGMTPWARLRRASLMAVRRPVVWAPALALVFAFGNIGLPLYAQKCLSVMGTATAGAALFLTGLIVSAQKFEISGQSILAVLGKNIVQPALALALSMAMALPLDQLRAVVMISAIPCGFFGLVFGKGFGSSPAIASSSLILSYLVGIVSLAGWIVLLGNMH